MSSDLSRKTGDLRNRAEFLAEIDRLEKRITDLETVCRGLKDENEELTKIQAWLQDEAATLVEESQQLALIDALTNIPNRRALHSLMHRRLHAPDHASESFAYLLLDLENLKSINHSMGHVAGDNALKRCAATLSKLIRDDDILARYGGDEFVLVLGGVTRESTGEEIARMMETLKHDGLEASVGAAFYPEDGTDEPTLFTVADRALYAGKRK